MNKRIIKLALRDLKVNSKRNRLVLISILISVFLIGVVIQLSASFYDYMMREMKISGEEVMTVAFGNKVNSLNYKYLTIYSDTDLELVRNTDGVKSATGVKGFSADAITYDGGKQIISTTLYGIDEAYLDNLSISISSGAMPVNDNEALIGYSIHTATRLNIGDAFQVDVHGKIDDFKVVGIIEHQEEQAFNTLPSEINQMIALNNNSSYVAKSKYGLISAIAEDVNNLGTIADRICDNLKTDKDLVTALDGTGLEPIVASRKDVKEMLANWFGYIALFIGGITVLIGLIASVNIINTFSITIHEKYRDIAVFKIVGASEKQVRAIYVYQCMDLGLKGSGIGALCSILVSLVIICSFGWRMPPNIFLYVIPFAVGIIISFLAGISISRKTDSIDVNVLMSE